MARSRFVPEVEPAQRRYGRDDEDFRSAKVLPDVSADIDWQDPEYASVEALVEYLLDCERTTYLGAEMQAVASRLGIRYQIVKDQLESYGFTLQPRQIERSFRTYGDNPHNRWTSEEALRMNGGGGGNCLIGMAP